ncbi:MAG: hypothetical protein HC896_05445 [Bacteroidales bacterium]|nr:hypothetical protein [Bacteroidales bacterium]
MLHDMANGQLVLSRDHVGSVPLYYCFGDKYVYFSDSIVALKPYTRKGLNNHWVHNLLVQGQSHAAETQFNGIKAVRPAHYVTLSHAGEVLRKYWDISDPDPSLKHEGTEQQAVTKFRQLLNQAIICRMEGYVDFGCELSGGLDSGSVYSLLHSHLGETQTITSLSNILNPSKHGKIRPYTDEKGIIGLLHNRYPPSLAVFVDDQGQGLMHILGQQIELNGYVPQQNFSTASDLLYQKLTQHNIKILFSGFGGDEVVSSHGNGWVAENVATNQRLAWELLRCNNSTAATAFKFSRAYVKRKWPGLYLMLGSRLYQQIKSYLEFRHVPVKNGYARRHKLFNLYATSMFTSAGSMANYQSGIFNHPHIQHRLEIGYAYGLTHGFKYAYPLLDRRLISFYYHLPPEYKIKSMLGRNVMRETMKGILPEEIRMRNVKTGATVPSVYTRLQNDCTNLEAYVKNCQQRGVAKDIIDYRKLWKWVKEISHNSSARLRPAIFLNYISLLIYLDQFHEQN